jgi:hypothetical protein
MPNSSFHAGFLPISGRTIYKTCSRKQPVDIPGEICQGRCFKSATHSGGNLPGIPDESLPLVL